jgi:hypothetical protein
MPGDREKDPTRPAPAVAVAHYRADNQPQGATMATAKQITEAARIIKQQIHSQHKSAPSVCAMRISAEGIDAWIGNQKRVSFTFPEPLEGLKPGESVNADPDAVLKAMKEYKPGDKVTISAEDGNITTAGITLAAVSDEDWSDPPRHAAGEPTTYNAARILAVAQFASKNDMRPVLTGVRFDPAAVVATDSYRRAADEQQPGPEDGVTVPRAVVEAVCKMAPDTVRLAYDARPSDTLRQAVNRQVATGAVNPPPRYSLSARTKSGNTVQISDEPIAGQFPNYRQLFPERWDSSAVVKIEEARKQAAKVNRWAEQNRPVVISHQDGAYALGYGNEHDGATVAPVAISGPVELAPPRKEHSYGYDTPGNPEAGKEKITIITPEPVERIGLNGEFFAAALDYVAEDVTATLHAISPLRPIMLEGDERRALVMPIRLNE